MSHREKRIAYLVVLVAVCLAGCSSTTTPGGTTSKQSGSATTASDAAEPSSPTASAAAPAVSSVAARPLPARDGDVDGDGRPDSVSVAQSGGGWRLTAELTRLGTQSLQLTGTTGQPVSVEGVVDLDHDGHAEVSLQIDRGASTTFSSIVRLVDNQLAQLRGTDGNIAKLESGGSVTHIAVWGCQPPTSSSAWELWQWAGTADAGASTTYSGTKALMTMRGETLITLSTSSFQAEPAPAGGCGSLHV